jgi:hypothetical protein
MSIIAGGTSTGIAARIYVLREEDWERAIQVMAELSTPPPKRQVTTSTWRMPSWLIVILAAIVTALVVIVLAGKP